MQFFLNLYNSGRVEVDLNEDQIKLRRGTIKELD